MCLRQYFSDRLTENVLFYQIVPAPSEPSIHQDSVFVLAASATSIDGFDERHAATISSTSDSVTRYLEEWYPTKTQFRQHLRRYVEALRNSSCNPSDACAHSSVGAHDSDTMPSHSDTSELKSKKGFSALQRLAKNVGYRFGEWRFYKGIEADDEDSAGLIIMRCDASAQDLSPCDCEECLKILSSGDHAGRGKVALFHFWSGGLSKCINPRDTRYPERAVNMVRKVGEGHPSEVYQAVTCDGKTVAAKRLKDWKKTAGGSLAPERDWLLSFDHPNILPYLGAVVDTDGSLLYLLTEFMVQGRLSDVCRKGPVAPNVVVRYGIHIASGLHAMHSVGIMHRDLHSDNILVTTDRAVVADLGSAKKAVNGARHTDSLIHYKYIKPPEVCAKSTDPACLGAEYGTPFDVWALACMIIGMALGIPCIEMRPESKLPADIEATCVAIPLLSNSIQAMLSVDADARPAAGDIAVTLKDILKKIG
eukprot:m.628402 g.628402  ORF g.628402 m.628402 type:complete len:478 (-) comp22562_c0_seq26:241-1674(-)